MTRSSRSCDSAPAAAVPSLCRTIGSARVPDLHRWSAEQPEEFWPLAINAQLAERAVTIIETMGARVIGPEEVRAKLGLTKRAPGAR